jgi:predicted AlkP superfamily phosphohydrolase/phosphomutase
MSSAASNGPSVIAICVEVASAELMSGWLERGWMPNLARVREEGAWCTLESITELSSGSIWPSFFTGVHPGKHGQFFTHMQIEPGTYRIVKKYANDVPRDGFWMELDRHRRSSTIIDVAQSRPSSGFRGVHVAGWGSEFPAWPRSSEPPALIDEVLQRFGEHPLTDQYKLALKPETEAQYQLLHGELLHGVRTKAALSRWLLEQHTHDFFLTVFPEPHWATHLMWDTLDTHHPRRAAELADGHSNVFREVLATIDGFIGEARAAHPHASILVFSLSGMGPNYSGWHILPELLTRLGMTAPPRGYRRWLPMGRWGAWTTRAVERAVGRRTLEVTRRILPRRLWDSWTRRILHAGGGWADSRMFWVPNDYSGALRVNLKGREPHGRVQPGSEYEAVLSEVTAALHELRHLQTGRPLVREVLRPQERWKGPHADILPDLLVVWANESLVDGACSERVGTIHCVYPERRTGAHRSEAFLAAAGPGIARGATMRDATILDLAPTFLHLCGVPVPPDYDGRVLLEMMQIEEPLAEAR